VPVALQGDRPVSAAYRSSGPPPVTGLASSAPVWTNSFRTCLDELGRLTGGTVSDTLGIPAD